ncbi:hypothetical protein SEPCBS57363_003949 [Sporothrix epigloea]|uniref:SET domain-containing protein n=1 Tax=Sporothrix epigloea TaxID=1892477 RepID=A0ABP0DR80_9PEZI
MIHKLECKVLKIVTGLSTIETPTGTVDLPLLMEHLRAVLQVMLQWSHSADLRADFESLESNLSAFKAKSGTMEDLGWQVALACRLLSSLVSEEVKAMAVDILARVYTNALDRTEKSSGQSGICIDATLSMVNHSCLPNAFVAYLGRTAYLRAQHPIAADDEITICYVESMDPLSERKVCLDIYNFECDCRRCRENLDNYQAALISPALSLNTGLYTFFSTSSSSPQKIFSIVPSLNLLRNPPVVRQGPDAVTPQQLEHLYVASSKLSDTDKFDDDDPLQILRDLWKLCTPLIKANRWVDKPVVILVTHLAEYCQRVGNYPHMLVVSCFYAQHVIPYLLPALFETSRNMGLVGIARAIFQVMEIVKSELPKAQGGDGVKLAREARGQGGPSADRRRIVDPRVMEILPSLMDGHLYVAILTMIMNNGPLGHSEKWPLLDTVNLQLDLYFARFGVDRMASAATYLYATPSLPQTKQFFEEHILDTVNRLSALAPSLMERILKAGGN